MTLDPITETLHNERAMRKIVGIVLGIILVAAVPLTVLLVGQRQELRKKAAPATTLSLVPSMVTKKVGDIFTLEAQMDTGENRVVAVEIHVVYDPTVLEAQTITNGPLFPNVLASGVVERGTASISVGAATTTNPVVGTGTAATIRFKALAQTDAPVSIRFAANTFAGSLGEGTTNVLVGTQPATVTITTDATATTQTSTTQSATITPTLTPTLAASGSASATTSAIQVLTPAKNTSVVQTKPTINGKAPPGSTVTITVYSTPQTTTVIADANGNWSYTPQSALDTGPHNVVASTVDPITGKTVTSSSNFIVASGAQSATQSAIPVSGSVTPTLILLFIGVLFLTTGIVVPIFLR
ncbi:MAG: cohesin domain-containing protein [Patescibacteria group bacterium]